MTSEGSNSILRRSSGLVAPALLGRAAPARAVVSRDIGPPGTAFTFQAEGFEPNEIVTVVFRTPSGTVRFADGSGIDLPVYAAAVGRAR